MNAQLLIQPIRPEQAAELSALCRRIYPPYYTYLWDDAGEWYVEHVYNEAQLRTELEDTNVRYYFAVLNDAPVGYLKLKLSSDLNGEPGGFEVERIYFGREAAGRGFGTQVMEHAFALARQLDRRYVWLHVMDSSADSIAFYRKLEFEPVGETGLPYERMKPPFRRMIQMRKALKIA